MSVSEKLFSFYSTKPNNFCKGYDCTKIVKLVLNNILKPDSVPKSNIIDPEKAYKFSLMIQIYQLTDEINNIIERSYDLLKMTALNENKILELLSSYEDNEKSDYSGKIPEKNDLISSIGEIKLDMISVHLSKAFLYFFISHIQMDQEIKLEHSNITKTEYVNLMKSAVDIVNKYYKDKFTKILNS